MSEPILEMKNISKNFGSVIALKNVDLEVYPGEIRGLSVKMVLESLPYLLLQLACRKPPVEE